MSDYVRKTKLFVAPPANLGRDIFLIESFCGRFGNGDTLFNADLPAGFSYDSFEFVPDMQLADYILIPHSIKVLDEKTKSYLEMVRQLALSGGKKVVVFIGGDLSHNVFIDDMIVLKGSQYRHLKRKNEIIVPPFVEDLGEKYSLVYRDKGNKPTVGFCGWSDFSGFSSKCKYWLKNLLIDFVSVATHDPNKQVFKKGLFFRRRAIGVLSRSVLVEANIISRKTFSGNLKTISKSVEELRLEYVDNMKYSDFVLAPKGDGNFSLRFYEALTLGRIPILIDTDCVLPLEQYVNYDQVILRVPWNQVGNLDKIVGEFFARLSPEAFLAKQKACRELFVEKVRYDSFFNLLFSKPLESWLE